MINFLVLDGVMFLEVVFFYPALAPFIYPIYISAQVRGCFTTHQLNIDKLSHNTPMNSRIYPVLIYSGISTTHICPSQHSRQHHHAGIDTQTRPGHQTAGQKPNQSYSNTLNPISKSRFCFTRILDRDLSPQTDPKLYTLL